MRELGKINDAQLAEARAVVLSFKPQTQGLAAPHFVGVEEVDCAVTCNLEKVTG
jgi:hypothetical protein